MPYLDVVARRPYNQGLHACWDLKRGERVQLRVDNWHDPMVVEACKRILDKYGCTYEIMFVDKGAIPQWKGSDEVEYYLYRTKELAQWMDQWDVMSKEGKFDKLLWGYGGPVLVDTHMKIQRMPFITPEILASPAYPDAVRDAGGDRSLDLESRAHRQARAHHRSGRHRRRVHQSRRLLRP